jgi:hypothetical protein
MLKTLETAKEIFGEVWRFQAKIWNFQGGGHPDCRAVMTGLVPVIHVGARSARHGLAAPVRPGPIALPPGASSLDVDVDGRDKPGHDGNGGAFAPQLGSYKIWKKFG